MNVYPKLIGREDAGGIILAVASSFSRAQDAPRFDVATLKVSPPPKGDSFVINLGDFRNGRLTMTNVTLNDAIKFAYEIPSEDLLVGPDWNSLGSVRHCRAGTRRDPSRAGAFDGQRRCWQNACAWSCGENRGLCHTSPW